ncbi:hypothetical protein HHI36_011395 [Cryptolaemus montrouzieri]|uniref:Uncharacterized protein n=1 Tax=Cryptolaemus montrouzieri TaxID=559131 RepID=A0ABD2MLK2_9CUCU
MKHIPSVVIIQERHMKHGENFIVFKVNNRNRREYITKFMSFRRMTYHYKTKSVVIGRRKKELRYKGSPFSISRLLLLDGLGDPFPTISGSAGEVIRGGTGNKNPSVSFFNLSDIKNPTTPRKVPTGFSVGTASKQSDRSSYGNRDGINSVVTGFSAETSKENNAQAKSNPSNSRLSNLLTDHEIDVTSSFQTLVDFNFLFGSDALDFKDFRDSDRDCSMQSMIEDRDDILMEKNELICSKENQQELKESIKKIEKDVKHIANNIESAFVAASQKIQIANPQQNMPFVPGIATGQQVTNFGLTMPPSAPRTNHGDVMHSRTYHLPLPRNAEIHNGLLDCICIRPSGSVPFFRVAGGCVMVIRATNQTTPTMYGTFCKYRKILKRQWD